MRRGRLKLTFTSDWHIGSGTGIPGSVDQMVLRDVDGLPYVPGKTLTGIFRDAAEWIAEVRDGGNRVWRDVLIRLFGTDAQDGSSTFSKARVGVSSAVFDEEVRDYILTAGDRDYGVNLVSALFSAHPGVEIDPKTGRAEDEHLFSMERVRGGCELYANVSFYEEDEALYARERRLFDDALKAVRRIGGKRRRGAGDCRLEWVIEPVKVSPGKRGDMAQKLKALNSSSEDSVVLELELRALQPLLIARKVLGNVVESELEIPGSMLLSYYTQKVMAPLGKDRVRRAVMDNELSVGNFLPVFGDEPSMPVPLCLAERKEGKSLVNRLTTPPKDDESAQLKDLRAGYITVKEDGMKYHVSGGELTIRTHNTVENRTQHPAKENGGPFIYEAIRPGATFRGRLKVKDSLWQELRNSEPSINMLAHDEHSFGRSRKDEYGLADLRCLSASQDAEAPEVSLLEGRTERGQGKYLVVYLLSDLLLRDTCHSRSVRLEDVRRVLEGALEVELLDVPDEEWEERGAVSVSPLNGTRGHAVRIGRRDSWQGSWGLPRPSLVFFRAGSIFLFKVKNPDTWNNEKAKKLMTEGLGERRAEGYGRVLLNPAFLLNPSLVRVEDGEKGFSQASKPCKLPRDEGGKKFAAALAADAVRRRFRQIARREAYEIVQGADDNPFQDAYPEVRWSARPKTTSPFGALRKAVSTLSDREGGLDLFKSWADRITKERKDNPWETTWGKMLLDLSQRPDRVWSLRPSFHALAERLPLPELRQTLSITALNIFLDILCEAVFDVEKWERKTGQGDSR